MSRHDYVVSQLLLGVCGKYCAFILITKEVKDEIINLTLLFEL
jgi:hypothetical protein